MASIRDVALRAGVSASTVSNYLNNKKRMKEDTARRIAKAIDELHYVVQMSGHDLRSKENNDFGIIFPNISEPYLEKIISSIKGYLAQNGKSFIFELSDGDPQTETKALYSFIGRNVSGIILYTCQPQNEKVFRTMDASHIPYVLIDRKSRNVASNIVTVNNASLFHNLTSDLYEKGHRSIALVCGPEEFDENRQAHSGFTAALLEKNADPSDAERFPVVFTSFLRESGFRAGMQLLENAASYPTAILTTGFRLAEGIRYALSIHHLDPADDVQIICTGDSMDDVFYNDSTITKTWRSSYTIGETAGRLLLENVKSPLVFEKQEIVFEDTYPPDALKPPSKKSSFHSAGRHSSDEITVMLLDDDASIHGLQQLLTDFYAQEKISINIKKVLPEHAFEYIEKTVPSEQDGVDVFMFDVPWLKYLVEKQYLMCLDDWMQAADIREHDFVPNALNCFGMHNGHCYSLPYMACSQLLFYRKDLFEDKDLCARFEDEYMIPLEVPKSWLHFNTVSKFFSRAHHPKSPVEYGHAMTITYPEQLVCDLMPRIWAYGDDFCNEQGAIHLNTPPIVKAVKSMLDSVALSEPSLFSNRPFDVVESFTSGKTAMIYTFFNYATNIVDRFKSDVSGKFGYTHIPGNCPALAGWSLGISQYSKKADLAFRFINWACGSGIAIAHTILGGQSPQMAVYRNYDLVSLYPWLPEALSQFDHCRERKTPFSSSGHALNEKQSEDLIFQNLIGLMRESANGGTVSTKRIKETLTAAQNQILRKLK